MHGWDDIVEKLSVAYTSLPEDEKSSATFLAPDYGIAGAIDLMGARYDLPAALSRHNNYWHWGPPEGARTFIIVGGPREMVQRRRAFSGGQLCQGQRSSTIGRTLIYL